MFFRWCKLEGGARKNGDGDGRISSLKGRISFAATTGGLFFWGLFGFDSFRTGFAYPVPCPGPPSLVSDSKSNRLSRFSMEATILLRVTTTCLTFLFGVSCGCCASLFF